MSNSLPLITLQHLLIANQKQIGLQYYSNKKISEMVNNLPFIRWSDTHQMPYIPNNKTNLSGLYANFKGVAFINGKYFFKNKRDNLDNPELLLTKQRKKTIAKDYRKCPENYLQTLEIKRYARNTANTYIASFERFINYYKVKSLDEINEFDIRNYLSYLVSKNYSDSFLNQAINSIKFYYEIVLGMPNRFYNIGRPRKKESLPKVISKEEVALIIKNTNNIKHKCIVSLLYSAGLRRSELLNLKLVDIDSKRMLIKIINGKGKKDRNTLLSSYLLSDLREYYKEYLPKCYLFEGPNQTQYSANSVSNIIHNACKRAKLLVKVTPHTLRHSFATHLLESGTNLRYIQELLGHASTRTTEIYTHVATNNIQNIKSPLDSLN